MALFIKKELLACHVHSRFKKLGTFAKYNSKYCHTSQPIFLLNGGK